MNDPLNPSASSQALPVASPGLPGKKRPATGPGSTRQILLDWAATQTQPWDMKAAAKAAGLKVSGVPLTVRRLVHEGHITQRRVAGKTGPKFEYSLVRAGEHGHLGGLSDKHLVARMKRLMAELSTFTEELNRRFGEPKRAIEEAEQALASLRAQ